MNYKFFTIILLFGLSLPVISQTPNWPEDINFLISRIEKTVPDYDSRTNWEDFKIRAETLKKESGSLPANQVILGIQALLNELKDEGCRIYPFQESLNYKVLPIKTYLFTDGLYILNAEEAYSDILNNKITHINGIETDQVIEKLSKVINGDNEHYKRHLFPLYSQIPEWLISQSVGTSKAHIELTLETGQKKVVKTAEVTEYIKLKRDLAGYLKSGPDSRVHENENYWMEYLEDEKILYIQFLQISDNKKGGNFKSFVNQISKYLDDKNIDKLVIDNRFGGGGNGFKLKPFTDLIRESRSINQKGKLFILTSRYTRGTVMELTSILELNSKAIIIGEPTGEGPNLVGDGTIIELPNSGVRVHLTKKFWPTSWEADQRLSLEPHVKIDYSFIDYNNQNDPWMEAVRNHLPIDKPDKITSFKKSMIDQLSGEYLINGRKVKIYSQGDGLFISMQRKMQSFFEFHSQIYYAEDHKISTDIKDVALIYSNPKENYINLESLNWKGSLLKIHK